MDLDKTKFFIRYVARTFLDALKDMLRQLLRPKNVFLVSLYITIFFLILTIITESKIDLVFAIVFLVISFVSYIIKLLVAGEWYHEYKKQKLKELREKYSPKP